MQFVGDSIPFYPKVFQCHTNILSSFQHYSKFNRPQSKLTGELEKETRPNMNLLAGLLFPIRFSQIDSQ